MLKGKEKDDQSFENILNMEDVVSYNDFKFHSSQIVGIKELGTTTQIYYFELKRPKINFLGNY